MQDRTRTSLLAQLITLQVPLVSTTLEITTKQVGKVHQPLLQRQTQQKINTTLPGTACYCTTAEEASENRIRGED